MFSFFTFLGCFALSSALLNVSDFCENSKVEKINTEVFKTFIIPTLEGKHKGEAGKIGIFGGSIEYSGAPYFAAISALKAGADLVYVITTESAAPIIKSYSPDLIVYPFLHDRFLPKIKTLLPKLETIVIGSGLGRERETLSLFYEIIHLCKEAMKPLVIDADGLYALSKNISIIEQYPSPGVILTPNHNEAAYLDKSISKTSNKAKWYKYWGDYVSVLIKGKEDKFYSAFSSFDWSLLEGGSGRRVAGQGDILAGVLSTFFNWAYKSNLCTNYHITQLEQSLAAVAAANLTRACNYKAFKKHGRSMIASDMLIEIHEAFDYILGSQLVI